MYIPYHTNLGHYIHESTAKSLLSVYAHRGTIKNTELYENGVTKIKITIRNLQRTFFGKAML